MHGGLVRLVLAARGEVRLVRAPEREMHRIAHLLVEEDVVRHAVDPAVHPDAEFAEAARAVVRLQHLRDGLLALRGRVLDDAAALESQVRVRHLTAVDRHRDVEDHLALRGGRRGEHLTGREVVRVVVDARRGVHRDAPLDRHRQVRPVPRDDAHLSRVVQCVLHPRLFLRLRLPVAIDRVVDEFLVRLVAHPRLLGERSRRVLRQHPLRVETRFPNVLSRPIVRLPALPGDVRRRRRVPPAAERQHRVRVREERALVLGVLLEVAVVRAQIRARDLARRVRRHDVRPALPRHLRDRHREVVCVRPDANDDVVARLDPRAPIDQGPCVLANAFVHVHALARTGEKADRSANRARTRTRPLRDRRHRHLRFDEIRDRVGRERVRLARGSRGDSCTPPTPSPRRIRLRPALR
ncbi:hypothetical protein MBEHAL_0052 [Halarchaeum acidiphilum MH1-52-1]|uniref:Uncharacterized protein n=1 Tax=Halarchaeum acidiphilum MH1-52-1 TaxID=1261545 RepID=U2YRE8_9EURY|nr:hypothetical protein MBEHAL_0052 [Halarchaeum acidiphilum MH1-52-1]